VRERPVVWFAVTVAVSMLVAVVGFAFTFDTRCPLCGTWTSRSACCCQCGEATGTGSGPRAARNRRPTDIDTIFAEIIEGGDTWPYQFRAEMPDAVRVRRYC